ncbi:MAG: NUDIX hydrolase [Crocinitomicaceae bacterium]|nr:NUDIX hydrolase [Crocinitomicaceae bacterium]
MEITNFNLRVYGLLISDDRILITHEHRKGIDMTKFPGGGLEKGEGLKDCLIREFREELGIGIEVGELFYVNDFLQVSAFNSSEQLISFYYLVETKSDLTNLLIFGDQAMVNEPYHMKVEFLNLEDLHESRFTFPIDKIVAEKLRLS